MRALYLKRAGLIFKIEMLMYQSKANLDDNFLFDKITHHLDSEVTKMLVKGMFGNKDSTFQSCPLFTCY